MMFYDKQSLKQQNEYKKMLSIIGSLSGLFSDSDKPMLYYRAHENCFCKYFNADNLSRHDCSADAKVSKLGIGLKTWVGTSNQKVAEFGKVRDHFDGLSNEDLIRLVSEFRNERIKTTKNMYDIEKMVYHVITRETGKMTIKEGLFDLIDIPNIKELPEKNGKNTCYFTDGKHTYNFNKAKTTLYMLFDHLQSMDEIPVKIIDDPFILLENLNYFLMQGGTYKENRKLCLKLYSENKAKGLHVPEKSGLNQWNADGRKRHPNEVYIPFPSLDRHRPENKDFFPPRDHVFDLKLPDGKTIKAKICQDDGKAIMSNPNKDLGKWLLRDVLELEENEIIDYLLLQKKGFDAVIFEKLSDLVYKIDFTDSSTYDEMYIINNEA